MGKEKYKEGIEMRQFERIDSISGYNYNYYVGLDKDLLLGISDDDNTTEWYVETGNPSFSKIGESYTSEGDILYTNK